ncbi:hypothetical protein CAOG_02445 [Capsaspora owczarzaki ATCC 30864]|uniref:ferroxidase n=1 Tax=Capsaspora owczarzaki (strain ATCC 30864) TaxID=595528 RepID=A0A0D2U854_CAPO3|nr:hypothetical protein CAOG_02445 [Capsaspora owczarzaki ATCC 30864]KJE91286.1 hypothetical protein CAOG_002445 [Capsaspora owczarzaki ATCC 30864]|eukprot:XP_004349195.2 hypothetical protein CAOG_02445 [Capsaspora owczarzaki ATCC 30864]
MRIIHWLFCSNLIHPVYLSTAFPPMLRSSFSALVRLRLAVAAAPRSQASLRQALASHAPLSTDARSAGFGLPSSSAAAAVAGHRRSISLAAVSKAAQHPAAPSSSSRLNAAEAAPSTSKTAPSSGEGTASTFMAPKSTRGDESAASALTAHEYHRLADSTLHDVRASLEETIDNAGDEVLDYDIIEQSGVMTMAFGSKGTYVLNKQAPNQQMWLSSPASGPHRFDWSSTQQAWISTQNPKLNLLELLETEFASRIGLRVSLR